jgi:Uncharacterized protein conserved in bacteria (DUF2325)
MRIGMVGGEHRDALQLKELAEAYGHGLERHDGRVADTASVAVLRDMIARSELVIILTDTNSPNAVRLACRHARTRQVPLRLLRRLGVTQFAAFVRALPTSNAA